MRYARIGFAGATRAIHPVDQALAAVDGASRESILHVDAAAGQVTLLYRFTGEPGAVEAALADRTDVLEVEFIDEPAGFSAYIRASTDRAEGVLLPLVHGHGLVLDTPVEITADGVAVTLVGTQAGLRAALDDIPVDVTWSVLDTGKYAFSPSGALSELTPRQREVFRTAVEEGYYDNPRQITQRQLAEELGCKASTVDNHLRKVEKHVLAGLLG